LSTRVDNGIFGWGTNHVQIGDVLIQWGDIPAASGGEYEITFPIAYTTIPSVVPSLYGAAVAADIAYSYDLEEITTTTFTIQARQLTDTGAGATDVIDSTRPGRWIAIGLNTA